MIFSFLSVVALVAFTLSPVLVRAIVALVIPVVTGLFTKLQASASVKATVAFVLSGVASLIMQATTGDGSALLTQKLLVDWAITFGMQLAAYLGLLKPVAEINTKLIPDRGIS